MSKNYNVLSQFFDGMTYDLDNHIEQNNSYQYALNGRIYSKDGVVSFSSIDGTIEVLSDPSIKKYLGYASFRDELILFTKTNRKYEFSEDDNPIFDIKNYDNSLTCDSGEVPEIDYSDFYELVNYNSNNFETCPIDGPEFNTNERDGFDTIFSVTKDDNGDLVHKAIWSGYMGWNASDKIVTVPISENMHYKRVYFTDNRNPFRVINLKDKSLFNRSSDELELFQGAILLEPIIDKIESGGSLKASSVFYTYRLITSNGQVTQFSPHSEVVRIIKEEDGINFQGGGISQNTGKKVRLKIFIPSYERFENVEVVAIEYEAEGIPTAIRSLGIKKAGPSIYFEHLGSEAEFSQNITISELLNRSSNWRYCSSINTTDNILFAGGLRNNPMTMNFKRLQRDFSLKSWDKDGNSYSCLLNSDPTKYRYITTNPADNNKNFVDVKGKIYTTIKSFGSTIISLNNLDTGLKIQTTINLSSQDYEDIMSEVYDWLSNYNQTQFESLFPNLKISFNDSFLVFSRTNENINTDISNYQFSYSNTQVIEDYYENYDVLNHSISTASLIHGAVSLGFNKGNGIRISFKTEKDRVLNKHFKPYIDPANSSNDDNVLLNLEAPSLKKGFMKGEIYRIGLQINDNNGEELFVVPLGDVKIPEIGDKISYINDNGIGVQTNEPYNNSEYNTNEEAIFAIRTVIQAELRISCEIKKYISSVKLVYVERTEDNRTILCQGFSAPMERYNHFSPSAVARIDMHEEIVNKWVLPSNGGPAYDYQGMVLYDERGENFEEKTEDWWKRVVTSRSLMYFDSPDIIYGKTSSEKISSSKIERVQKLITDHHPAHLHSSNFKLLDTVNAMAIVDSEPGIKTNGYFSRKLFAKAFPRGESILLLASGGSPDNLEDSGLMESPEANQNPMLVNISFFHPFTDGNSSMKKVMNVKAAKEFSKGQISSGSDFDLIHQVSNNAMVLMKQAWFHSSVSRAAKQCTSNRDIMSGELWKTNNVSSGNPTVIMKSDGDIFDREFVGAYNTISSNEAAMDCNGSADSFPNTQTNRMYQAHALINIKLGNEDSVYGGRTDFAYANNIYRSLSKTIPILKENNGIQKLTVQGDMYSTLYVRVKNDMVGYNENYFFDHMRMGGTGTCGREACRHHGYNNSGAWVYMTVLETMVEPRFSHYDDFLKDGIPVNFNHPQNESINPAYFQESNLKSYIPIPFHFKDDPDMNNIISASDVKLTGDYIDNWSVFRVNNFYEVEKDKGTVHNIAKHLGRLYAIQEQQTSVLLINQREMIEGSDGQISVQQGTGEPISDHQIISDYGTSIRRAVGEISSNSESIGGFVFYDERKNEFVKVAAPILLTNRYHLKMVELMKDNIVIDSEAYFDDEYKESVIRLRTKNGEYYTLSYNEVLKKINGFYEYNNDIYINWNDAIYAPKKNNFLHQLNKGYNLRLFSEDKSMKIGVVINPEPQSVKIFKHWAGIINIERKVDNLSIVTSLGQERVITNDHNFYKIREGRHSVPLKNPTDWDDLRGEWMYIEAEISNGGGRFTQNDPDFKKKINIFSFINFVRNSYQ